MSVEDQATANDRVPTLAATPAAARCVSVEPLLGRVFLRFTGCFDSPSDRGIAIDWVILGGESGPRAHPMHPDWARWIRDDCRDAGVPFFFKQWGEWWPRDPVYGETDEVVKFEDEGPNAKWVANEECVLQVDGDVPIHQREDSKGRPIIDTCHFQPMVHSNPWAMLKVGKKFAGRELDGREHNGFPSILMDRAAVQGAAS